MLTDAQCKAAKAAGEAYKLSDAHGLRLDVSKTGHRSWRHKYRYGGKEKLRTLGTFPEVTLKHAREICKADKQLLKEGKDPIIEAKRAARQSARGYGHVRGSRARMVCQEQPRWKPVHAKDVIESLERDIFDDLGSLPVMSIDSTLVLATLQKVEARGAIETAHRLRQRISSIFAYGIAKGRAIADPAAPLVKVLKSKPPSRRWPAVTKIGKAREVLAITDGAEVTPVVKLGSRFLALTSQRPGMVRWMRWDEIEDFDPEGIRPNDGAIWTVPAHKMKQEIGMREDEAFDHPVPLSGAAVDVLCQAWLFSAGSDYVFPGQHSMLKPMSENALSYLYLREGLRKRHVPHGWRASFSTIMNEWVIENGGPRDPLILDLMLAHIPRGISASELRYMRAGFIERHRKLATTWAELLLEGACPVEAIGQGRRRRKA